MTGFKVIWCPKHIYGNAPLITDELLFVCTTYPHR